MKKLTLTILMIFPVMLPYGVHGSPRVEALKSTHQSMKNRLSVMISNFDLFDLLQTNRQAQTNQQINQQANQADQKTDPKLVLTNFNGNKKTVLLTNRVEQFQEYTKYTFLNPFSQTQSNPDPSDNFDLYIFNKVKPTLSDDQNDGGEADLSDLRVDVMLLVDSATKKTIKSKVAVFYKDSLVGKGSVENNSQIKITDDLNSRIKNCKLNQLKVIKNSLASEKRSLDVELGYIQGKKMVKQMLNVSLLNMKQTPIPVLQNNDMEDEQNMEDTDGSEDTNSKDNSPINSKGINNETSSTHS